jgi:hypothetical protein
VAAAGVHTGSFSPGSPLLGLGKVLLLFASDQDRPSCALRLWRRQWHGPGPPFGGRGQIGAHRSWTCGSGGFNLQLSACCRQPGWVRRPQATTSIMMRLSDSGGFASASGHWQGSTLLFLISQRLGARRSRCVRTAQAPLAARTAALRPTEPEPRSHEQRPRRSPLAHWHAP